MPYLLDMMNLNSFSNDSVILNTLKPVKSASNVELLDVSTLIKNLTLSYLHNARRLVVKL